MSNDHMKHFAIRWFEDLWNRRQDSHVDDVIRELAHANATTRVEGRDGRIGLEEFKMYRAAMLSALSDFSVELTAVVAEGDRCHVEWQARGVHTGHGLGVAPSGRPIAFNGITALRFADGKIIEGLDKWNRGELIASLMRLRVEEIRSKTRLTEREAQVALMMAERLTHMEIARDLRISPSTSRRHCERVLSKLRVHRRQDVAAALGLIKGSPLDRCGLGE